MSFEYFDHDPSIYSPYWDNQTGIFKIGQVPLKTYLQHYEKPIYFYSREQMEHRYQLLRDVLPPEINIHYATKANPHPKVLRFFTEKADGLDIASIGELDRLLELGITLPHVSFAGPGKGKSEIEKAIKHGVHIVVESMYQLELCNEIALSLGKKAACMVRINDHQQVGGSGLSMAGAKTFFGIDIDEYLSHGLARFSALKALEFKGFHLFYGSQNLNAKAIAEGLEQTGQLLQKIPVPREPVIINIGGGLGIPYTSKDKPLDLAKLRPSWRELVKTIQGRFPNAKICTELGRFLVGPAGLYVCQVLDKKKIKGNQFVVTDGGMHHFSAATGNFGQVLKKNHPLLPVTINETSALEKVTISGRLCTPIDVFGRDIILPRLEIGDFLLLFQAGAYGFTASPRSFLSHPEPDEKVVW